PDPIAGARVAVAGLSDTARVDQGGAREGSGSQTVAVNDPAPIDLEDARDVGVAVEADPTQQHLEVGCCRREVADVFEHRAAGAGVDQLDAQPRRLLREGSQPADAVLADLVNGPANRRGGLLIEPAQGVGVGAGPVVVAGQGQPAAAANVVEAGDG